MEEVRMVAARKKSYIPHPKHIPFEYDAITDHIYVGTNQC